MLISKAKSVYRNPIYRQRRVKIQIKAADYEPLIDYLELTEVTTFDVQTNSGVAVSMGVKRGVIQPWYFGPYNITVSGKSNIGAYADERINYNRDDDVAKLMGYSLINKDSFLNGDKADLGPPNGYTVVLSCFDPNYPGLMFGISSQYEGYIDDIK